MNDNKIIFTMYGTVELNKYGWPVIAGVDLQNIVTAATGTGKAIWAELTLRSTDEPAHAAEKEAEV